MPVTRIGGQTRSGAVSARLNRFVPLGDGDRDAIEDMCRTARHVPAQRDVIGKSSRLIVIHVVLDGWACRYRTLRDGGRHIPALLLPGDFCRLQATMLDRTDHGIAAITPVTIACIDHLQFAAAIVGRHNLVRALRWATLVEVAVMRSWIVGLGGRSALGRVADLICELRDRSAGIGIGAQAGFPFPLTQAGARSLHIRPVQPPDRVITP